MILRVVLIQMKPEHRSKSQLQEVARRALNDLPGAAGVLKIEASLASDARTEGDWDLCLLVRFASMRDTATYRTDPVHRAFADDYLKPLRRRIFVYHFDELALPAMPTP